LQIDGPQIDLYANHLVTVFGVCLSLYAIFAIA